MTIKFYKTKFLQYHDFSKELLATSDGMTIKFYKTKFLQYHDLSKELLATSDGTS